ncbi:uncharacterized protein LOC116295762 [Actinia tenebrosa]|uniref:Uncharacterized protein LOC116295762 n=1 Tax=Actinia tenebrosa TaxID=6105 RepID=A0A6P8I3P7_ACTTE|nr:uncharacterized protein LOC116295762 [Actinia tenebrosa]XP_031559538.1 uncharacterized protein LOC116295762 [Actinia tenebrosa]
MNGTIDLSSSNQDLSSTASGDQLQYVEDDNSWSETSDSCSCSSCGTCSMCDICNVEDFRLNVGNKKSYAERESAFQESNRLPLSSLQEDQPSLLSIKNQNHYETSKGLSYTSRCSSKNKKHANSDRNCTITSNLQDPIKIVESNYVLYSSGSDKERNSSFSSSVNSGIINTADSSSENSSTEFFTGLPLNTEERPKHEKKVTFSETFNRDTPSVWPCERNLSNEMQNPVKVPGQSYGSLSAGSSKKPIERLDPKTELISECIRLQSVLKNIDPFLLRSLLLHQLEKKDARTILTLGKLFPTKIYPLDTIHCVRCHNEYNPFTGRMGCKVTHPINAIARLCQNDQLACYSCAVCKKEYWVNILEDDVSKVINHLGYCFVGTHSPTVDEVSYFPQGAAKSCEDMGCIEFYV